MSEFIFVDESGDPGYPGANPLYILVATHVTEPVLSELRRHLASFRYFHEVTAEFKDWGKLLQGPATPQWRTLMGFLGECADADAIVSSANWLNKEKYVANGGPHLNTGTPSIKFRNYQLRRLLERHKARRPWGPEIDIVLDRWSMSLEQRRNLEDYIRGNWKLRPIGDVTTVSSSYVDSVQLVDLLARFVRRSIEAKASPEEIQWCTRLLDVVEIEKGLY